MDVVWQGPEALSKLLVPVDSVTPDPDNLNRHDDIAPIVASFRSFGQQKPIVVLPSGVTVAGEGSLLAVRELGWTHIAAITTDLADDTAAMFALADNEAATWSRRDVEAVGEFLASVAGHEDRAALDDIISDEVMAAVAALDDQGGSEGGGGEGGGGLGSPVVQHTLIFDDEGQQQQWFRFLRWLKGNQDGDTIAERLIAFLNDHVPDALEE